MYVRASLTHVCEGVTDAVCEGPHVSMSAATCEHVSGHVLRLGNIRVCRGAVDVCKMEVCATSSAHVLGYERPPTRTR